MKIEITVGVPFFLNFSSYSLVVGFSYLNEEILVSTMLFIFNFIASLYKLIDFTGVSMALYKYSVLTYCLFKYILLSCK